MSERPAYNLARIEEQRDRLHRLLLERFNQQTLAGDVFPAFVTAVSDLLPNSAGYDAVFESCRCLLGRIYTPEDSLLFCWRLAGNTARLKEGGAVHPWAAQRSDEWVPVQIVRAISTKNRYDQRGTEYTFRVLAGTPAGMRITAFWKPGAVRLVAEQLGFSRPKGKYPLRDSHELVGLRCYVLIQQERSAQAPAFFEVDCPASLVDWNREQVLKMRARIHPCPRSFAHPCHRCAVGYAECPAGTHRRNFEKGFCALCGNAEAVFDPEENSPHCIDCNFKERMRRQTQ